MMKKILIIDFDSTFVRSEGLPELAQIALRGNPGKNEILKEIERITDLGMNGEICFTESLKRRIKLLGANKAHVEELGQHMKTQISLSIEKNRKFFEENKEDVLIFSGGFFEFVFPVVDLFGIPACQIFANTFEYDSKGMIVGFDEKNCLSKPQGKVQVLRSMNIEKKVFVVGDGFADYEMREAGLAHVFIAFTENVKREKVMERADFVVDDFSEVIEIYHQGHLTKRPKTGKLSGKFDFLPILG